MLVHNNGETQISREGDRFEVPVGYTRLSILVTLIIEIDKGGNENDRKNGIDERKKHEIPLVSIDMLMLAKNVRFLEYYKQELGVCHVFWLEFMT